MSDQIIIAIATASVPTVAVLLASFLNNRNISDLRQEIRGDIQGMRSEVLSFRAELGGRFALIHSDIGTIVKLTHDLDKRVGKLEDAS
jgi:hypothetical protein